MNDNEKTNEVVEEKPIKIEECLNCGSPLEEGQEFCAKCGMKRGVKKKILCANCGAELTTNQKFCPICGAKSNISANDKLDEIKNKYRKCIRKINWKTIIKIAIAILIIIALFFVGKAVFPKIFVSTEDLISQGNYEEAYKKAKNDQKEKIYRENIIAVLANEVIDGYKDPSSFDLRDAWFNEDEKFIVIKAGGKNSYGGIVFSYDYFTYSEKNKKYEFYCSISSLEKEEYRSYDNSSERLEKALKNIARIKISSVIYNDKYKIEKESINNINQLFKQGLLSNVKLLEVGEATAI